MNKYTPLRFPSPPQLEPFRLPRIDGGLNLREEQSNVRDNQSPRMLNLLADDRGALHKRPGQEWLYDVSLGEGSVHLYVDYRKKDGNVITLLHHGTKLYTQAGTNQPVELYSGLADQKGAAFVFNDIFHYINNQKVYTYDGLAVGEADPEIPTVVMGRSPDGTTGGTKHQDFNLLIPTWNESFSADGTSSVFKLTGADLSAQTVKAWVNDVEKTEGTHFTVDRVKGEVDFAAGSTPHGVPAAGTDNIIIQPTKDGIVDATKITECRYYEIYGGPNDTRIFLTGNPDYPSAVFWCDVYNPGYWPENNNNFIGSDAQKNTVLRVYRQDLILLKERSVFRISFRLSEEKVYFDSFPVHSAIGCDMPESVQIIDNFIVFSNTYAGAHILTSTEDREEKNVKPLSGNINGAPTRPGLLDEAKEDLLAATSVDYDGKYWLNVGSNVYVWDYKLTPYLGVEEDLAWFPLDNIKANCWLIRDRELYYGHRDTGKIVKFINRLDDFGQAINAYWRLKLLNFNLPEWYKKVNEVYFRARESTNCKLTVKYFDDEGELLDLTEEVISASFSWSSFKWSIFAWSVHHFPPTYTLYPYIDETIYFQMEINNNIIYQDLPIMDLVIPYKLKKRVR